MRRAKRYTETMRAVARLLNDAGNSVSNGGHPTLALWLYKMASLLSPSWSFPVFNIGLREMDRLNWKASLAAYQKAAKLNEDDEATWWNLATSATALRNWPEAMRGWEKVGLTVLEMRDGEVYAPCPRACVRVDPNGPNPEVVWGERLDPARIRILNVPFGRSGRRYNDIILNSGAPSGTRTSGKEEFPVFDELDVWKPSAYSTFSVTVRMPDQAAEDRLTSLCEQRDIAAENWGTVRMLCGACSRGNPGEHVCAERTEETGDLNFGFAATSRDVLIDVLDAWSNEFEDVDYSEPHLELLAGKTERGSHGK